jgi:hypothetical protein
VRSGCPTISVTELGAKAAVTPEQTIMPVKTIITTRRSKRPAMTVMKRLVSTANMPEQALFFELMYDFQSERWNEFELPKLSLRSFKHDPTLLASLIFTIRGAPIFLAVLCRHACGILATGHVCSWQTNCRIGSHMWSRSYFG